MFRRAGLLLLLGLFACNPTSGCAGDDIPYPHPPPAGGEVQIAVARGRLTENFLDFIRTHLPALLDSFFVIEDGRAVYYLDEALFDPAADPIFLRDGCVGEPDEPCANPAPPAELGPTYRSSISFDAAGLADALELSWLTADSSGRPGVHIALRNFEISADLAVVINIPDLAGVAACHIQDAAGAAALEVAELSFDLRLAIDDTGTAPVFATSVEKIVFDLGEATGDSSLHLAVTPCDGSADPTCNDPRCVGASGDFGEPECPGVCGLVDLFSQLGGFLNQFLAPLLEQLAPALATAASDALASALGGVPVAVTTEIAPGTSLLDAEPLHLSVAAHDLALAGAGVGRGLDVALDAGITAAARAGCVAETTPPQFDHGPPPDYSGFIQVGDDSGSHVEAYHFAAGLSQAVIQQAAWAAHQSGLLCIDLDTYEVEELTQHAFTLTAGLLASFDSRLTGLAEPAAPMLVSLSAPQAPNVRLGAGGSITPELHDPLIELGLNDVEIDIYLLIDGEYLRLSGIITDIVVSLVVERTPDHTLELLLDSIDLSDEHQVYNEMAPAADLSSLVALAADLAVDQLLGDASGFEIDAADSLSSALGVPFTLRLNDLRRDLGPSGTAYLSLFATLCDADDLTNPDVPACYTSKTYSGTSRLVADEASLYVETEGLRFPSHRWSHAPSGRVLLKVDAAREHQTRVDGGPWSRFRRPTAGGILEVSSPRLHVLGVHRVEVRSRPPGEYRNRSGVEGIEVLVDSERPKVTLWRNGDAVHVSVEEIGTPHAVALRARMDGGPWSEVRRVIDVGGRSGILEVVASDLAGNNSPTAAIALSTLPTPPHSPTDDTEGDGCAAAPGASWAALLGLRARRRRRQDPANA